MHRVCVCLCVCTCMCTMEYTQRSEDNVWDLSLSIHFYVGSGAQAYGIRLEQQAVYLLCHLMDHMYLSLIKALVKKVIYLCVYRSLHSKMRRQRLLSGRARDRSQIIAALAVTVYCDNAPIHIDRVILFI